MRGDLVHALAELGEAVGRKAGADCPCSQARNSSRRRGWRNGRPVEMPRWSAPPWRRIVCRHSPPLPGCHCRACGVVGDPGDFLPGVAAVAAAEERRRLDAAKVVGLVAARGQRPDVLQRAAVVGRERGRRFRRLELLPEVFAHLDRRPEPRRAGHRDDLRRLRTAVDERRVDRHVQGRTARAIQGASRQTSLRARTTPSSFRRQPPLDWPCVQPPETAGRMVTTSPAVNGVSSPARARTWSLLTKTLICGRGSPRSSHSRTCTCGCCRAKLGEQPADVAGDQAKFRHFVIGAGPPHSDSQRGRDHDSNFGNRGWH